MKHTLGKLSILLCFVWLQAEDFSYHIEASKHEAYLHEPLLLSVDLNQTNPDVVLLFQFAIKQSPDYRFKPIFSKNENTLHHTNQHTIYEITPLKTGDISLRFSLIKRVTTDDKVSYFASGDRDDFKKLETINFPITLPPVKLHIKTLPKGTQLVGDFQLSYTLKKHQAQAHEPIPFQVTLKGKGFPPLLPSLLPKEGNFTRFIAKPMVESSANLQGTYSTIHYTMALSSAKDFRLPPLKIKAFNPKTQQPYTLTIPAQTFKISEANKSLLLDKIDYPPVFKNDWKWIQNVCVYLLVFAAGFLSAFAFKWRKKHPYTKENPIIQKIKHINDSKSLLQLLMSQNPHHFASCIRTLEDSLYGDGKIKLSKVKEEAIDLACTQK